MIKEKELHKIIKMIEKFNKKELRIICDNLGIGNREKDSRYTLQYDILSEAFYRSDGFSEVYDTVSYAFLVKFDLL